MNDTLSQLQNLARVPGSPVWRDGEGRLHIALNEVSLETAQIEAAAQASAVPLVVYASRPIILGVYGGESAGVRVTPTVMERAVEGWALQNRASEVFEEAVGNELLPGEEPSERQRAIKALYASDPAREKLLRELSEVLRLLSIKDGVIRSGLGSSTVTALRRGELVVSSGKLGVTWILSVQRANNVLAMLKKEASPVEYPPVRDARPRLVLG